MAAAEDIERQVAIRVVVAVEEPALLVPVQRIVGGVQIKRDLGWRLRVSVEEQINEQGLDSGRVGGDTGIASGFGFAQFQAVQRALARQWRAV